MAAMRKNNFGDFHIPGDYHIYVRIAMSYRFPHVKSSRCRFSGFKECFNEAFFRAVHKKMKQMGCVRLRKACRSCFQHIVNSCLS